MNWVTALLYNAFLAPAELRCMANLRRDLVSPLFGRVLEIGAGTGKNLPHYSPNVDRLVLAEPDGNMRGRLASVLPRYAQVRNIELCSASAEALPFDDASFDFVVSTLVYCSVSDLRKSLSETKRVLSPQGKLCIIEHVAAPIGTTIRKQQAFLAPIWRQVAGGCRLEHDLSPMLSEFGFDVATTTLGEFRGVPSFLRPLLYGTLSRHT